MSLIDSRIVGGKEVFVFDSHHHALIPWSWIRRNHKAAPYLITLDHHTDTYPAFNSYRCGGDELDIPDFDESLLESLIAAIDFNDDRSLHKAISILKYDEHIDTAVRAGIIQNAFAINLSSQTPSIEEDARLEQISLQFHQQPRVVQPPAIPYPIPPFTYTIPDNGIFEISSECAIGCPKMPHVDDCVPVREDQVLESFYLDHELLRANEMGHALGLISIEEKPYILDIDLDYFHSEKAINPKDTRTFYRLIRGAIAITIALEQECVEDLRQEDSQITSESLLTRVLEHIQAATA